MSRRDGIFLGIQSMTPDPKDQRIIEQEYLEMHEELESKSELLDKLMVHLDEAERLTEPMAILLPVGKMLELTRNHPLTKDKLREKQND